jgi:hypothetical protein
MEPSRERREPPERDRAQPKPAVAQPHPVLALQRAVGNAAVANLLARDIKPGDTLPNLDNTLKNRVERVTNPQLASIPDLDIAAVALRESGNPELLFSMKSAPNPEEFKAAKSVLQRFFDGLKYHAVVNQALQWAQEIDGDFDKTRPPHALSVSQLVTLFINHVEASAVKEARDEAVKTKVDALKKRTIAKPIDPANAKKFTTALKGMDFIKLILSDRKRDPAATDEVKSAAWEDGGNLQDTITEDTGGKPRNKQIREDIDNGKLAARVAEADRFIKLLVEPEQLGKIKRPSIVVHTKWAESSVFSPTSWFDDNVYRANQAGNVVNIAQNEESWIVVHEVGHYLEKELPIEVWTDIRALIQSRHAAAAPPDPTKAVGGRGSKSEGGFAGEYAATGKYTSRAYSTGDTEMMSLTIEFLKNPGKTLTMLEKDPVQAATILRHLRPKDYAANVGDEFDEFIPNTPVPVTL